MSNFIRLRYIISFGSLIINTLPCKRTKRIKPCTWFYSDKMLLRITLEDYNYVVFLLGWINNCLIF